MGKNARRRREAKAAARPPQKAGAASVSVRRLNDADALAAVATPGGFSRQARRTCDECGGSNLVWTDIAGLRTAVAEEERTRVDELAGFVGSSAEAWRCETCGNFGAFGGFEASDGW